MIERAHVREKTVELTEGQKVILAMSEDDIETGRTVDQFTLNESELEWLRILVKAARLR